MIEFRIENQKLTIRQPLVASDTVDFITAECHFSSEWNNLVIYAHFRKGGAVYDVRVEDGKIDKEQSVNLSAGNWDVYFSGHELVGDEFVSRVTTNVEIVRVVRSGVVALEPFPHEAMSPGEAIVAKATEQANKAKSSEESARQSATNAENAYRNTKAIDDEVEEHIGEVRDLLEKAIETDKEIEEHLEDVEKLVTGFDTHVATAKVQITQQKNSAILEIDTAKSNALNAIGTVGRALMEEAAKSATQSNNSAEASATSASQARTSETNAKASENAAATKASEAASSATQAAAEATKAEGEVEKAKAEVSNAQVYANEAKGYRDELSGSIATVNQHSEAIVELQTDVDDLKPRLAQAEKEIENLNFEVSDLKNIVYDTIIEDEPYTFEEVDNVQIPPHIQDASGNYHKVFDGAELAVTEIEGNTANADLCREAHIYGNNVRYNQLRQPNPRTTETDGVTFTEESNGSIKITGALSNWVNYGILHTDFVVGHKYLVFGCDSDATMNTYFIELRNKSVYDLGDGFSFTYNDEAGIRIRVKAGYAINKTIYPMIVDLTEMSEESINTRSALVEKYPSFNSFVPYTTTQISAPIVKNVTYCGNSLLDITTGTVGLLKTDNGEIDESFPNNYSFRQYILVKGLPKVYLHANGYAITNYGAYICFFKADKTFLRYKTTYSWEVEVPSNAVYMRIGFEAHYGNTYRQNTWVSIENDTSYTPFNGQTITFPQPVIPNGLSSKDEIYSYVEGNELVTNKIERYGTLTLDGSSSSAISVYDASSKRYKIDIPLYKSPEPSVVDDILCNKLQTRTKNGLTSGTFRISGSDANLKQMLFFLDTTYDSKSKVMEWLTQNNLQIVYPLATPTITEISRVPLTCDFEQVSNIITDNTQLAKEEIEVKKGVLKSSKFKGIRYTDSKITKDIFTLVDSITLRSAQSVRDRLYARENEDGTFDLVNEVKVGRDKFSSAVNSNTNTFPSRSFYSNAIMAKVKKDSSNIICDLQSFIDTTRYMNGIYSNGNGAVIFEFKQTLDSLDVLKATVSNRYIYYELATPTETIIATGLTESDIAILTEKYSYIEVIGNSQKQFARPNVKTLIQVEKAIES